MTDYDPVASVRRGQLTVDFHGRELQITPMTAGDWVEHLYDPELEFGDIFPGLLIDADGRGFVDDLLFDGKVTVEACVDVAKQVLSAASGRPWWLTLRILAVAKLNWELVGGELALAGMRADLVPFGAWLDAVYLLIMRNVEPKRARIVEEQLKRPPFEERQADFDEEREAEAFMAALGAQVPA